MTFIFQNLRVYQLAVNLAEQISKLTDTFPKGTYYLKDQLNRAALSIALNIAEGNGRFHKADRRQFFYIARGSCHECVPIIEICFRRGLVCGEEYCALNQSLVEIAKMVSGLIKGIENCMS